MSQDEQGEELLDYGDGDLDEDEGGGDDVDFRQRQASGLLRARSSGGGDDGEEEDHGQRREEREDERDDERDEGRQAEQREQRQEERREARQAPGGERAGGGEGAAEAQPARPKRKHQPIMFPDGAGDAGAGGAPQEPAAGKQQPKDSPLKKPGEQQQRQQQQQAQEQQLPGPPRPGLGPLTSPRAAARSARPQPPLQPLQPLPPPPGPRGAPGPGPGLAPGPGGPNRGGALPPRFFMIKSASIDNFMLSRKLGVWATQAHNEPKLDEAFKSGAGVMLVMSVNNTGHFQGIARMLTPVGAGPRNVKWVGLARPGAVRNFGVRWEVVHALPFQDVAELRNPWNENQPVRIGRDGQEIHPAVGAKLLQLMRASAQRALQQQRAGGGAGAGAGAAGGRAQPAPRLGQGSQQQQGGGGGGKRALEDLSFEDYLEAFRAVRRRIAELEELRGGGPPPDAARAAGGGRRGGAPSARPGARGGGGGGGGIDGGRQAPRQAGGLPPPPMQPPPPQGMGPGVGGLPPGMVPQLGGLPGGVVVLPISGPQLQLQHQYQHLQAAAHLPPEQFIAQVQAMHRANGQLVPDANGCLALYHSVRQRAAMGMPPAPGPGGLPGGGPQIMLAQPPGMLGGPGPMVRGVRSAAPAPPPMGSGGQGRRRR